MPPDILGWSPLQEEHAPLLQRFEELGRALGSRLYLVGGAVRDLLLGEPSPDWDLCTEAPPEGWARGLQESLGGSVELHPQFGAAHWVSPQGQRLEITRCRRERYAHPGALPQVEPASLLDDLRRRDFTVNAMALDLHSGALVDPHRGREALAEGELRLLHPASWRDDPTRMWRAARFSARFGFRLSAEDEASLPAALQEAFHRVSLQRMGMELERLFSEAPEALREGVRISQRWGLWGELSPRWQGEPLSERLSALRRLPEAAEHCWLELAQPLSSGELARLETLVPGGQQRLARWRLGEGPIQRARESLMTQAVPELGLHLQPLDSVQLAYLSWQVAAESQATQALAWWREAQQRPLLLGGQELIRWGFSPGPRFAEALQAAQLVAWAGGDRSVQEAAARRCLEGAAREQRG